ncbi:carboxypeptidase-like regulatory domain-containing protein [Tunturibacter psychrotolerans]|uniref:Carboxypeptidase-like regulatory domain-containing protein n=1 Tax=Tunturiibacter psychrotolerans TaxID=3069686 RepID=A0AAU7ZVH7_9BACT
MRSNTRRTFILRGSSAIFVLIVSCFLQAQSQSAILTGIVKDASGAVIPKAEIDLKDDNGQVLKTTADNSGSFTIEGTPGQYALTASSQGFEIFTETVHLTANASTEKQLVLQVGSNGCGVCVVQTEPIQLLDEPLNLLLPLKPLPPFKFRPRSPKNLHVT